jgi:hypothetical protein
MEKLFDISAMNDLFKSGLDAATQYNEMWRGAFDAQLVTGQKTMTDAIARSFDAMREMQKVTDETMQRGQDSLKAVMQKVEQSVAA